MPANKRYLIQSRWTKASKIMAMTIGGYACSVSVHLSLAYCLNIEPVIATSLFTIYLLWSFFMVMVYWIKNIWKVWGVILLIITISALIIYLKKS